MKQFTNAAANTMQDQNTGLGNFMADIMKEKQQQSETNHTIHNDLEQENDINMVGESIHKPQRSNKRREMTGPRDLDNLLSNLKTTDNSSTKGKSKKKERNVISFDE